MENGDSDTDKYPHRTGHNAGHNQLHGTWTVLLVTKRAGGDISFGFSCFYTPVGMQVKGQRSMVIQ